MAGPEMEKPGQAAGSSWEDLLPDFKVASGVKIPRGWRTGPKQKSVWNVCSKNIFGFSQRVVRTPLESGHSDALETPQGWLTWLSFPKSGYKA
jgi:hypothetical protein